MPFSIICSDITKMNTDAIVNSANCGLKMGGGVCGAIFEAAGDTELSAACGKIGPIETGTAAVTPAFNLKSKCIIHAVGPRYSDYTPEESAHLLYSAYNSALKLAEENGCKSIAFPLISSNIYGYPKEQALKVASAAIKDYLENSDIEVYLVMNKRSDFPANKVLMDQVTRYIYGNYSTNSNAAKRSSKSVKMQSFMVEDDYLEALGYVAKGKNSMPDDIAEILKETFSAAILRLMAEKGKTDAEVCSGANISKKLFAEICADNGFKPGKRTVLALAVALELDFNQTYDLLQVAGYVFTRHSIFDMVIEYFINDGNYDVYTINEVLFALDQPLLGM